MAVRKKSPTWSDVKAKLADFDRASLQGLVKDLYGASKDNQAFLHARLGLGSDVLKPYKVRIHRWVWPDLLKNQDVSASKAKKVITDYKKSIGRPEGLAELMVFYCERASDFSNAFGFADELADTANDPEAALQEKNRSELLCQALTRLSADHREIIDLVYYHENSVEELRPGPRYSCRHCEDPHVLRPEEIGGVGQG